MSRSKVQIAMLTGVILTGVSLLQIVTPQVADNLGLLYLRAEYKLATGDADSARKLLDRVAASQQKQETSPKEIVAEVRNPISEKVTHNAAAKTRRATVKPMTVTVAGIAPVFSGSQMRDLKRAQIVADTWSKIQTAWEGQREYEQVMRVVEAKLKNLPTPPTPPGMGSLPLN